MHRIGWSDTAKEAMVVGFLVEHTPPELLSAYTYIHTCMNIRAYTGLDGVTQLKKL
jgi:hypothetical protein